MVTPATTVIASAVFGEKINTTEISMDLMEVTERERLSREQAAARLHALADALARHNEVGFERGGLRFTVSTWCGRVTWVCLGHQENNQDARLTVPYRWLTCQFAVVETRRGPLTPRLERPVVGPPKPVPPTPGPSSIPILTSTDGAARLTQN